MGEATEKLLAYRRVSNCYAVPFDEVRDLQAAAMNEHLQERIDRIKLVKFRAEKEGVSSIDDFSDIVPLLLPHTAYKSYPESFLFDEKWDKLTKWLGTVSAYPIADIDFDGIDGIDEWLARLEQAGHHVACSSGTTGKTSMLIASEQDIEEQAAHMVRAIAWGTGVKPAQDYRIFGVGPTPPGRRVQLTSQKVEEAFGRPDVPGFYYPGPPMTTGAITKMVALRKAMAEGTAMPAEIAAFEQANKEREQALAAAMEATVDALLEAREEKMYLSGLWGNFFQIATAIRERGYSAKDFHPENILFVAGGLKLAKLPPDYREYIYETFNIAPQRNFLFYGMQEMNTQAPRCSHGRYHFPPWVVSLPLNKEGDALLPMEGEVEGRAAFFDLSMDGRWGGIITGDKIEVDYNPCGCGAQSPSIKDTITRYKDLEGDDKISCAGTVDAYVRGLS